MSPRSRAAAPSVLVAIIVAGAIAALAQASPNGRRQAAIGRCTMALPDTRTTIEVRIPDAADFCELVSQALAEELFYAPMIVTPGQLWHYPDAALSCRLRYRLTPDRITVHNSPAACDWLAGLAPGWHADTPRLRARAVGRGFPLIRRASLARHLSALRRGVGGTR